MGDGYFDFAYCDDWDHEKKVTWINDFTDPALQQGERINDIRVAGAQAVHKKELIPVFLLSNKSPYVGKWHQQMKSGGTKSGFKLRFHVIHVKVFGNVWGL